MASFDGPLFRCFEFHNGLEPVFQRSAIGTPTRREYNVMQHFDVFLRL